MKKYTIYSIWICFHFWKNIDAVWTLTGSSRYAAKGQDFELTCNPNNNSTVAVRWKRLDIDTSSSGTSRAVVEFNGNECRLASGYDPQYNYTCEFGPLFKLTIPGNKMTINQNNKRWMCENIFGGASAEYKVNVLDIPWQLSGSSEFAVTNESFTLTCNPNDGNAIAVIWRRNGTTIAAIEFINECNIQNPDPKYQFACEPGPIYKLTIPADVMNVGQDNVIWRCDNAFGGVGNRAEYTLSIAVPVNNVAIQGDIGYPALNVIYENIPKTFTCITNGCRPKANITITTAGVSVGQISEKHEIQSDGLIVSIVTQTISATSWRNKTAITCSAVNIQGKEPIKSQTIFLNVYYSPIISLNKNPVIVSEGQDVKRICFAAGNPIPTVNWYKNNVLHTSDTGTLDLKRVTRNDTGIYTCRAETIEPSGNRSQIFKSQESLQIYVYYITISKAALVCSSSDSISISCCSVINSSKPLKFYGWKHSLGNTAIRTLEGKIVSTNNNSLSLEYCGYYDSGIYICQAAVDVYQNNTWQHFGSSVEITVPAPPVISFSTVTGKNMNNRNAMSVKFYSVPKPDMVEWIKNGEKLTFSNKYQQITSVTNVTLLFYATSVKVKGYESSLSIVNAVTSDFGMYTFRVQNSEGSAQIKLILDSDIESNGDTETLTGAIVGGVISFIAIVSVIVVIICVFKRRRNQQNGVPENQPDAKDSSSVRTPQSCNDEDRSYQDVEIRMYEVLNAADKTVDQYETLPESRSNM